MWITLLLGPLQLYESDFYFYLGDIHLYINFDKNMIPTNYAIHAGAPHQWRQL